MQNKIRLLIVDDDAMLRQSLSNIFSQLGYGVTSASDGFSALLQMQEQRPDVLLSDLNMPGMSGFELLSVVRRRLPGIYAIAMSGAFSEDGAQPGVAADAFYEKATKLQNLLELMRNKVAEAGRPGTFHHSTALTPIWILGNENGTSEGRSVTIACPDCLRTFSQVLDDSEDVVHETKCFHCATPIHFAIVQSINPSLPQDFQQKSHSKINSSLSVS
jgi:CheY-like chemotaxis protein